MSAILISKVLRITLVHEGSHSFTTRLSTNVMSHPAFDTQPQHITALCPVLIFRPTEGRRLRLPGWLVTYRGGMPARSRPPILVLTTYYIFVLDIVLNIQGGPKKVTHMFFTVMLYITLTMQEKTVVLVVFWFSHKQECAIRLFFYCIMLDLLCYTGRKHDESLSSAAVCKMTPFWNVTTTI